ncbi:unnamed protein product, partial [Scytosiphon promiscuus]
KGPHSIIRADTGSYTQERDTVVGDTIGTLQSMASKSRRRSAICLAAIVGLCLSPSEHLKCEAFLTSAPAAPRGSTGTTSTHPASRECSSTRTRSAVRSRGGGRTRVFSAVEDIERVAAGRDRAHAWKSGSRETLPLDRIDPEIVLFGTTAASAAVASAPPETDTAADMKAAVFDTHFAVSAEEPVLSSQSPKEPGEGRKRIKKSRRKAGKAPVVVEGDDLANTPKMI